LINVRQEEIEDDDFEKKLKDSLSISSLFLDDTLISSIEKYIMGHKYVFLCIVSIAEDNIAKKDPSQIVNMTPMIGTFDVDAVWNNIKGTNEKLKKDFENIRTAFKRFWQLGK